MTSFPGVLLLGFLAAFFGFDTMRRVRKTGVQHFSQIFLPILGWWGVYRYFDILWNDGVEYRTVALSYVYLGVSPFVGWTLQWDGGMLLRRAMKTSAFVMLWTGIFVGLRHGTTLSFVTALMLGCFLSLLFFLPYGRWKKRLSLRAERRQVLREKNAEQQAERDTCHRQFQAQLEKLDYLMAEKFFAEAKELLNGLQDQYVGETMTLSAHRQRVLQAETLWVEQQARRNDAQ